MSTMFLRILREDPADASVGSAKLLRRAGYIHKTAPGIWTWLPLGLRVLNEIKAIIREEIDGVDAQEVHFPTLLPREPYETTHRWEEYGDNVFCLRDRHEADYLLAPTHEEVFALLIRNMYSSYKDLPVTLYQIQTKCRDEFHPRVGLVHGCEFVMKDAYSFTVDEESVRRAYYDGHGAYERIFQRLDLRYILAFTMSSPTGGSTSEEFLIPMPIGEDTFALAPSGRAWNAKALSTPKLSEIDASTTPAASKEATPGAKAIDDMIERVSADHPRIGGREWQASDILRNVVVTVKHPEDKEHDEPWREMIIVDVPGDHAADMRRLKVQFVSVKLEEATEEDLKQHPELMPGYIGPMVFGPQAEATDVKNPTRYLINAHVVKGSAQFTGASENEVDYYDPVYGRDLRADGMVEAVEAHHGDMNPDSSGPLSFERGVEAGQVSQLGLKCSRALDPRVLDQNGKAVSVWMGCCGIGVSRVLACIAKTRHDETGLAWPSVIALAAMHMMATSKDAVAFEGAEKLVAELETKGLGVIHDDRKRVSPSVKFKDAELIGVPLVAVIGRDCVNDDTIELCSRNDENKVAVPAAEATDTLAERFTALS